MTDNTPDLIAIGQKNLKEVMELAGGEDAFLQATDMDRAYVHNWLRKQPVQQSITPKSARRIEEAFNKKLGWMHDHLLIDENGNELKPKRKPKRKSKSKELELNDLALYRSRHSNLDEMVASFIDETKSVPSKTNLVEFMKWSYSKTLP